MTVLVPLKACKLGNGLSILGSFVILAHQIGGSVCYPDFRRHSGLFDGKPFRFGRVTKAQRRSILREHRRWKEAPKSFRPKNDPNHRCDSDEFFAYTELSDRSVLVSRKGAYFVPFEAIDFSILQRYEIAYFNNPYLINFQRAIEDLDYLRGHLPFAQEHRIQAATQNDAARQGREALVGVHLRLGDYRTFRGGRYYFEPAGVADLLTRLDRSAPGKYAFRVFASDAVRDLEGIFSASGLAIHLCPGDAHSDFCALSQCDVLVGPPSSFSHWAAFLGGKPRLVLNEIAIQLMVIHPRYLGALAPVAWPFSAGLQNDFWIE